MARTVADPDLWGHVRFGSDILARGISRVDPYSFASDIPWVNHEWLAEIAMSASWSAAGATGLIVFKLALAGIALAFVGAILRSENLHGIARDLPFYAAVVGMWQRVSVVRPQIFSVALFAALLWILRSADRDRARRLWLLPPLFALWVNLHGGWIIGLGVLAIWAAIQITPFGSSELEWRLPVSVTIVAALATLINPYGLGMWRFLATTVRVDRPDVTDWQPLYRLQWGAILPWVLNAALAAAAFVRGRRSIPLSYQLIVLMLGVGALRVNRLDVFFSLSVVMLLAGHMMTRRTELLQPLWTPRLVIAGGIAILLAAGASWQVRSWFSCVSLDATWMPERAAGEFLVRNQLRGRMLTFFDWGEYAIWFLAPGVQVSFDGRRETVYSDVFVREHTRLYVDPGSEGALLRRLAPDYAWLPTVLPLVGELEREGWAQLYSGRVSVILARHPAPVKTVLPPTSPACFPGP